eukprot:CAMPEP_0183307274 /NCGR_PEP_ID=MMETSP0160_2-20130417/17232_1 /TAXON_ID=2839 ORGANISM="Odontella Sinensis, Strain Grunow 1884" /NCGR_SAMPLE_ID=MMETSP0160_2 /ASSEMBLY_ACC=CAM_ASM_000250 /LENGTH=343 /DNA_ID=CAMNT_0025470827 /DNA_START=140 /DNA_END=1171 /DNA_ORIENTATION=-
MEDGFEIEVTIPEDSKPGDRIEIPLPDDDDEARELFMQLHPANGNMLYFSSLGEGDNEDESKNQKEDGDEDCDGTNEMAWPAGIQLSQFITSPEAVPFIQDKVSVLDLGSGMGVSGLAIASALAELEDDTSREVVLTDLPNATSLLQSNVDFNREVIQKGEEDGDSKVALKVLPLTWGQTGEDSNSELKAKKFDLVVASDVLYNPSPDVCKALGKTMYAFLDGEGKILLSTRWRKPEEERIFYEEMERNGFEFKLINDVLSLEAKQPADEEKVVVNPCSLSWKDRSNTESEMYKKFFSDTKVEVNGESIALGDLTEAKLDSMKDAEFDQAEDFFIQIYVGQRN